MAGLFASQYVIDVENIIAIFIVIPVILHTFARFCQYPTWVSRRLVVEIRIANPVSRGKMAGQRMKRLCKDEKVSM